MKGEHNHFKPECQVGCPLYPIVPAHPVPPQSEEKCEHLKGQFGHWTCDTPSAPKEECGFKPFNLIVPKAEKIGSFGHERYQKIFLQVIEVLKDFYLCQEYYLSGSKFNVSPKKYPKTEIEKYWELRDK